VERFGGRLKRSSALQHYVAANVADSTAARELRKAPASLQAGLVVSWEVARPMTKNYSGTSRDVKIDSMPEEQSRLGLLAQFSLSR